MIMGGNINYVTRVLPTAFALETAKSDFVLAPVLCLAVTITPDFSSIATREGRALVSSAWAFIGTLVQFFEQGKTVLGPMIVSLIPLGRRVLVGETDQVS